MYRQKKKVDNDFSCNTEKMHCGIKVKIQETGKKINCKDIETTCY